MMMMIVVVLSSKSIKMGVVTRHQITTVVGVLSVTESDGAFDEDSSTNGRVKIS